MAPMMKRRRKNLNTLQISAAASIAAVTSNEDLLIEILIRLAVKPLAKFKSECKQWYSIISDHKFTLNHARTNHRLNGLLLKNRIQDFPFSLIPLDKDYQSPKVLPIHFLNYPGIEILHSCNGFLCYSQGYNDVFVPHDPTPSALVSYHVCHLTSGHTTKIRVFNVESASDLRAVYIAFDPLKSIHYKVVLIQWSENNIIKLDIYSSETRGWNTVKEVVDVPNDVGFNNRGVYCNGAIYRHDNFRFAVFYFDLDGEFCLRSISTPRVSEEGSMRMNVEYFGESSGHLHLIATRRPVGTEFTIYEMQRDKSNWFVKYHGDLNFMTIKYPRMIGGRKFRFYVYRPLCLLEEEEKEVSNLVLAIPGKLISYNLKNKELKVLCDLKPAKIRSFGAQEIKAKVYKTYQYMETLACI